MSTQQTNVQKSPEEILHENQIMLSELAKRTLLDEETTPTPLEDFQESMLLEYFKIGASFGLTPRDLAFLMYKDILDKTVKLPDA